MTPQDQAELARALFEEIGDALFLLDPDTDRLLEVNPTALRLTGFTRAELLHYAATNLFRFEAAGGTQRLQGAFTKTVVFHNQDGFLLRTREENGWVPVNLTVSRLHVRPKPLGLIIARDDRERRTALAQARRVERELRQVLASSPAALWSAERAPGPDVLAGWHFRYVSPLLGRIAGRPPEFLDEPLRWAEAVHPSDRDGYRAWVRRLLTGLEVEAEHVYRVVAAGGAVRWVRDRLQVVRDAAGRPTRLDGCLVDVTEQRQAEEALRQNEQRFRALIEKSRDGITLLDEKGEVKYASPAAQPMLGHDPAALVGKDAFAFVHPDDVDEFRGRLRFALDHPGEDVPARIRAFAADRSVRVVELNAVNRLADPSVRAVVVNYRDVTAEDRAARELADQHALLEGLFASVPELVCYKDRGLRFLGGNPAFEALAGRPVAACVGKTCRELFTDEWAARLRLVEPGVIETGTTVSAREWVTYPDGRRALLDIVVAPLRDDAGGVTGLIVVGRDATDRDRLEEQLRQSQKMEAVGRLAGGIAHDFNNLLTVILGNLELVKAGVGPADAAELVDATERAARQAADLTRQMLGFARRQPLRPVPVDVTALVRDSVSLLHRTIDRRIAIRFDPPAGVRPVVADPVQLQQVLMNLCLNARDAMPGGGTLTVETADAARGDAPMVRLSVADTGVGMTADVRARVFEPFFTTKDVGQGTGLGLAVVYGVAQAHGGWVECHSEPGRGSRFDVYLPAEPAAEPVSPSVVVREAVPPTGHGETVLVADDEPGVRELARAVLALHGYRVVVAADGAEAVAAFRRDPAVIRAVVLDACMPQLTGRQAFDAIRAVRPDVPVLFASGFPTKELVPDESTPGTAFLAKPFTPTELAATVARLVGLKPA